MEDGRNAAEDAVPLAGIPLPAEPLPAEPQAEPEAVVLPPEGDAEDSTYPATPLPREADTSASPQISETALAALEHYLRARIVGTGEIDPETLVE